MSNTIPPLLCSTPPPIDFEDDGGSGGANENDDFEAYESSEGVYGPFAGSSEPNKPKHVEPSESKNSDLPIPEFMPFPIIVTNNITCNTSRNDEKESKNFDSNYSNIKPNDCVYEDENSENINSDYVANDVKSERNDNSIPIKDSIGFIISEPPPIDIGYSSEVQSPKNSRGESPLSIEFSPGNLSDDDSIDFQINESRYDDNTSLPSLKFDAINISKSATPILEEKTLIGKAIETDESLSIEKEKNVKTSAFETISLELQECSTTEHYQQKESDTRIAAIGEDSKTVKDKNCSKSDLTEFGLENSDVVATQPSPMSHQDSNAMLERTSTIHENGKEVEQSEPISDDKQSDEFSEDFQSYESYSVSKFTTADASLEASDSNTTDDGNNPVAFEVDFSQVEFTPMESCFTNASSEIVKTNDTISQSNRLDDVVDDDFEDFQDFTTAEVTETNKQSTNVISNEISKETDTVIDNEDFDENDDDFGDFSDFKEAEPVTRPLNIPRIDDKLKTVLEMMFPHDDDAVQMNSGAKSSSPEILRNNLPLDLKEIDSATALEYQWLQSNIKNSLVKSLGIDSRNILYGEKWNASMPRFAANLGFGPLEPLKATTINSDIPTMVQSTKPHSSIALDKTLVGSSTSEVPAVKFDWNSSGLVNPLDGIKEILHERKTEKIHKTQPDVPYRPDDITSADKNSTTIEQTPVDIIASLSNINNDLKDFEKCKDDIAIETNSTSKTNYRTDEMFIKSPTLPPNSKLIPLKETHIFTPSKSEGTISRSVNKTIEQDPIDFDYEIAAAGIVINEQVVNKEYRDVVYNPGAQNSISVEIYTPELSQSENRCRNEPITPIVDPNKSFRQKSTAADFLSGPIMNIMEKKAEIPDHSAYRLEDEFDDFQQNVEHSESRLPTNLEPSELISSKTNDSRDTNNKKEHYGSFDEEFSEFQSVAPSPSLSTVSTFQSKPISESKPKSRTGTPCLSDEMILSPAILLPQAVKITSKEPKINWPSDSHIDPDELARLEQLFPQAKQVASQSFTPSISDTRPATSPKKEQKDDEDWSDFVSVPPTLNNMNSVMQEPAAVAPTKLSTISKTYDDEDWTDFVSSTPAPVAAQASLNKHWSISQLPPPQFTSWNQPSNYNSLSSINASPSVLPTITSTSHPHHRQNELVNSSVPTVPGRGGVHNFNAQKNNHFSVNGQANQTGVSYLQSQYIQHDFKALHHQQQQPTNQQKFPHQYQQPLQKQQRVSANINSNHVLKSQLNTPPSISLIPELGFTAPKPLVNLSRTNLNSKK